MNQTNHHSYYRTRAETSHQLARRAVDRSVAAVHADFAVRYERLIVELERSEENTRTVQDV